MTVSANADQAEELAMSRRVTAVSDSAEDELMSGALHEDVAMMDFAASDEATEALVGETIEELESRSRRLGGAYPFSVDGGALTYRGTGDGVYEFCLRTSRADHSNGNSSTLQIAFERVAAKLVAEYLGGGEFYRIGYPSHNLAERPSRLAACAELLHTQSGEWRWSPSPPHPADPDITEVKDEGVDFVVWKRLDDRPGSLFLAGQCACGQDWRTKFGDLTWDNLTRWWPRPSLVQFTRVFAIPRVIPGFQAIGEVSREAGLVFDRIRLVRAASSLPAGKLPQNWLQTVVDSSVRVDSAVSTTRPAKPARQPRKAAAARRSR